MEPGVDPAEVDLDAIERDLADVESELERMDDDRHRDRSGDGDAAASRNER